MDIGLVHIKVFGDEKCEDSACDNYGDNIGAGLVLADVVGGVAVVGAGVSVAAAAEATIAGVTGVASVVVLGSLIVVSLGLARVLLVVVGIELVELLKQYIHGVARLFCHLYGRILQVDMVPDRVLLRRHRPVGAVGVGVETPFHDSYHVK